MLEAERKRFQATLAKFYRVHGRHDLPWRQPEPNGSFSAYKIIVSEYMLQQTQVNRVKPKFANFIHQFPDMVTLSKASLKDVLITWQGLGYNRRARFLWQSAQHIMQQHDGVVPVDPRVLEQLPGIGSNTAAAITVYAFNRPVIFIETNIRTVFIHHFFQNVSAVPDSAIRPLIMQTMNQTDPRTWYWSVMDYGTYLKQTVGNLSRKSTDYSKQSPFIGSVRQIRGQALRLLMHGPLDKNRLLRELADPRAIAVLQTLEAEGMICLHQGVYELP